MVLEGAVRVVCVGGGGSGGLRWVSELRSHNLDSAPGVLEQTHTHSHKHTHNGVKLFK